MPRGAPRRVVAVCLDGYEHSLTETWMGTGELPGFAALRDRSARFALWHGAAAQTGLAGEHIATGLDPAAAGRFSAVDFDPATYGVCQANTVRQPFTARLAARALVFDAPYFNLDGSPGTAGIVNWGAHDPGVAPAENPPGLRAELTDGFGAYPATEWIYGVAWPSARQAAAMGEALARAVAVRARAAAWLLAERCPGRELALLTVSETHSVLEGLWHGVDPAHPLHDLPSAAAARAGVKAVYAAVDALLATVAAADPGATLMVFALHGMGPNRSDVASMLLLPELLYRAHAGEARFAAPAGTPLPLLAPDERWSDWVRRYWRGSPPPRRAPAPGSLAWMPCAWYAADWSRLPAFALPSFYDGRIRINLCGRESAGVVALADYAAACDRVEALLRDSTDPRTGAAVVADIDRPAGRDPLALPPDGADLVVNWHGAPLAFRHPELGQIGPAPYRRTGGHTQGPGFAWVAGPGIAPGDGGMASAFDVVPTLVALLGESPAGLSGRPLPGIGSRTDAPAAEAGA